MRNEESELVDQIKRCRRLVNYLTDEEMRKALEELAEDYEARLKLRRSGASNGFMLRE